MKTELSKIAQDLEQCTITDNEARTLLLGLLGVSVSLPVESFDADDFLNTKDIWNHPYISDRTESNGYEVAQLMAEFANKCFSNER
jgi:hypothetical protein